MLSRILYTDGNGSFAEKTWDKPEPKDDEIEVKALLTGICRSDIDMMVGKFGPLPLHMQGHEGLGIVTKAGVNADVAVGEFVATRGEPAYSDYYNAKVGQFIVVPSAEPKYIIEPVACAYNIVQQLSDLNYYLPYYKDEPRKRICIIGSGFLSYICFQVLLERFEDPTIMVIGNSNRNLWDCHLELQKEPHGKFDVVIDLKDDDTIFKYDMFNKDAIIAFAAEKKNINMNSSHILWNNCTSIFPSPRGDDFYAAMSSAEFDISNGNLDLGNVWTRGYDRDTEWRQAFADGLNRPPGYSRGYIKW